ncbi:MAG: Vitamin B12 import ATP-binding protein BtuD [Anaerolineae bacterium]|nr:Vitamin B12 import ATP-binding protein BtuD [Anaerolineae bacterium]
MIHVQNLGKRYRIGVEEPRPVGAARQILSLAGAPFRYLRQSLRPMTEDETLWAIRNISFQVETGEVLGIIGRNGAGKSTLLKILSRITEPTEGRVIIQGRVSSLLEVGTGFHPELTGRENTYLNGAILGMRKQEIDRKFDEIVEFSGIAAFMDTPVKRYSSGMYVRLAFAVAAHLEPEVLIVDEVLAVGDAEFQTKCLGKMEKVSQEGRTILFVSHNMNTIGRLCPRVVYLEHGRIKSIGNSHEVISSYLYAGHATTSEKIWTDLARAPGDDTMRLTAIRLYDASRIAKDRFDIRMPITIEAEYSILRPIKRVVAQVGVINNEGAPVFLTTDQFGGGLGPREPGAYRSRVTIPGNFLAEGRFVVNFAMSELTTPQINHILEPAIVGLEVYDTMEGDSVRGRITTDYPGAVRPMLPWHTELVMPIGHGV